MISTVLKTKAAKRDIPIPKCLVDCLREAKANSISEYVIADSEGQPLSYSQFTRVWQYVVVRSAKERTYYKYVNGQSIKYTVKPTLGTTQRNNPKIRYNAPSVLITVIHGFIHVTVITIVMFFFDWRIGLLACLGIALFLLCNSVLQKKSQEVSPKRQAAQEDLVGATLEYIQGMGIVKSFNLGGKSNQKMKQAIEESRARNTKLETVFGPYGMVQLFVLRLASVAIMFCSILFYLQGSMTLVYCLLMCVASFLIFSELEAAGGKSFALRLIESSIDKVNAIDDTPVMDLSGKDIAPKDTTIELQNVGFSYGNHRILNHVNLTIPAKTTTAIVGPSGSGKTTLCSLITRFWDVDEGCIKLGGTDIREYKLDSLLSNISMVFQNVFLFADSIENNIKFGKPDATHEEVVRAAKSACCRSQQ